MLKAKKEQKQQQQQQQLNKKEQNLCHNLILLMICHIKLKHLDVCQYGGVQKVFLHKKFKSPDYCTDYCNNFSSSLKIFIVKGNKIQLGFDNKYPENSQRVPRQR